MYVSLIIHPVNALCTYVCMYVCMVRPLIYMCTHIHMYELNENYIFKVM